MLVVVNKTIILAQKRPDGELLQCHFAIFLKTRSSLIHFTVSKKTKRKTECIF